MQYREWRFIGKSKWGDGPWLDEPDKVQWQDEVTGLPCLAVRNERSGNWCGYVGVGPGHPLYEKEYMDVDIGVHGGLTFAGFCDADREHGICHLPDKGELDAVYWFGFDCHHGGDMAPGYEARHRDLFRDRPDLERYMNRGVYRTLEYVKAECKKLAAQLQGGER
jgi:hypothetical protein